MKTPYDFIDNSIITGKYEYIFLCISVLLGLVDHKILKFITENFGVQARNLFLLMSNLKKKFKKIKIKKNWRKQQNRVRGRDGSGSGSGLGSRQGPAGPHPRGRRGTYMSHRRHIQTLFLPPSSQWRSSSHSCCRRCAQLSPLAPQH